MRATGSASLAGYGRALGIAGVGEVRSTIARKDVVDVLWNQAMDIFTSFEVRWFLDDEAAEAARTLFRDVPVQGAREDRYLVTGRDDLGFKARGEKGMPARVETKYLLASLGPTPLHDSAVGEIERWRKLSIEVDDPALEKDGQWIHVK